MPGTRTGEMLLDRLYTVWKSPGRIVRKQLVGYWFVLKPIVRLDSSALHKLSHSFARSVAGEAALTALVGKVTEHIRSVVQEAATRSATELNILMGFDRPERHKRPAVGEQWKRTPTGSEHSSRIHGRSRQRQAAESMHKEPGGGSPPQHLTEPSIATLEREPGSQQ